MVIPVLDDASALDALLGRVRAWKSPPADILVVAGGPAPAVEAVCRARACRLTLSQRCRGRQLDDGARATRAATIWFVHADAEPSAASLDAIVSAQALGAEAGYFRFGFTGVSTLRKRIIARLVALRTRCGGIPYGDQGLWMTRQAYLACGGFEHEPLFEEVRLVRCLRARGRLVALTEPIGVAPWRWERDGWLRRCAANRLLALGYMLGIPPARLAARYYEPGLLEDRSR